jgi:uncharacterized protein
MEQHNFIENLQKKHIVVVALALCIVDAAVLFLMRSPNPDSVTEGMIPRLIMIAITGLLLWRIGLYKTAGLQIKGFSKSLLLGLPLTIIALLILMGSLRNAGSFLGIGTVLIYTANMLIVGLHEELLVRGFLLNSFLERWKSKRMGIVLAVFLSSIIFGLMHFTNLAGNNAIPTIAQAVYATFIGIFFASIFIRTRNLYGLIILHAFIDWCFYFVSTCFQATTTTTNTGQWTLVIGSLLFAIIGLFYIRKSFFQKNVRMRSV